MGEVQHLNDPFGLMPQSRLLRETFELQQLKNERRTATMRITVKAFASVKDILGFNEREFDLQSDITVGDAVRHISEKFDDLKAFEENLLFVVNEEYCSGERKLRENDVLALFPPVSGG